MESWEIDEATSLHLTEEHTVFIRDTTVTDSEDAGEGRRRAWTQTLGCVFLGKLGETIITQHLHMVTLVMDQDLLQALTDPTQSALDERQVPDVLQRRLARLEWNGERILEKAMTSFRLSLRTELMPQLLSQVCELLSTEQDRHKVQDLAERFLKQYDIKLFGLDVGSLIFILQHPSMEDAEKTLRQEGRQRELQKALVSFLPEWAEFLAGWTVASYTMTAGDGAAQFGWKAARVVPFAAWPLPQETRSGGIPAEDSNHPVSTPVEEISPQRVAEPTVGDSDNSEREGLPVGIVSPLLSTPSDVPRPQGSSTPQQRQFEEKNTQTLLERRGAWWEGYCPELSWTPRKMALCVALPVLVSLLLGVLLLPPMPWWSAAVPYTAERVVLQNLDPSSSSLTGSLCGQHACSSHYDDGVTDVLVTADRRVVLTMRKQTSILVKSSSGDLTVQLGCEPFGVTQLPSGRVAVTCPFTPAVVLVSLEGSDPQIQRIQTKKKYQNVAARPVDNTLIVGAWPDNSIDIITLQGEVVRTLVDSSQLSLNVITSLAVVGENLLVTGKGSLHILQVCLSDSSRPLVKTLPGTFRTEPEDSAVDEAGNVFVVLQDGSLMMRSTEGHVRALWAGRLDGTKYWWCHVAVQDNRLLVVTVTGAKDRWESYVTELQLVDQ